LFLKILFTDLLRDLIAALLEVHDGVGDLDVDGLHHRLNVEGTDEALPNRY
jgi:hypothetical protein